MHLSRRAFTGGAASFVLGSQVSVRALAQSRPNLDPALAAIRSSGEAHLAYYNLPALTVGLTTPNGFTTVLNFGLANPEARRPIGPDTLFQIGSISKSMTATLVHQFAALGMISLGNRLSDLMPIVPLPRGNAITLQNLLDHTAGLADSPPIFLDGGLWAAYPPGAHWHYSNTAYNILGKLVEQLGGKPLDQLLSERILGPLGMTRTRGAIIGAERIRYAQGYEAADQTAVFARGVPLAPAPWVDVTTGEGNVASTAQDMTLFLRALADAAQGRASLGLPPDRARIFTSHSVPSDTPGMSYGNGLMHVRNGNRSYLHHTGGMISFSSSFHVDVASGVGAFASTPLSAFAEFRPRLLTRFAVDALTDAMAGRSLPAAPPLNVPLPNAARYVGNYSGPNGSFEVRPGSPLTIIANGEAATLQPWGGDIFRTTHPAFHQFSLMFERIKGAIVGASWGPSSYVREGSGGRLSPSNPALKPLTGRYVNDNPWFGTNIVVERAGKLWIGTETPMAKIGDNLWRIGDDSWSPERGSFANFINGRPQNFIFSGEKFHRHDI
jgi:CubicO group peptidase (beta-lactamase class C family)